MKESAKLLNKMGEAFKYHTNALMELCHGLAKEAGWWNHKVEGDLTVVAQGDSLLSKALVAQKLCLVHSEISEAMEGHRKGLMDDKLPDRPMLEVELADAVIRIMDLAGAMNLDIGGAIVEKLQFNTQRPDHKPENREKDGGKAY